MTSKSTPKISPVMQQVSAYIAAAPRKPLPKAVTEKTKHHVLDTLAAMVSGSRLLPGKKAISYVKTLGGNKEACVAGSRVVTTAANAALANGMLGHADETDDSHAPSLCHPGCAIVPAALAMAERERPTARRCCARSRSATTSARASTFRSTPTSSATTATRRTVSARCSAPPRRPARCSASISARRGICCRTRRSRPRACRAGCATRNTSKKRSTSAACRRATA